MVLQNTVNLPVRSEVDVPGKVVYKDLKDTWDKLASVPRSPGEEVRIARIILRSCCKGDPVAYMTFPTGPETTAQCISGCCRRPGRRNDAAWSD